MNLRYFLGHVAFGTMLLVQAPSLLAQDTTSVICGDPPVQETYCYTNSDTHTWLWQSSDGTSPLSILFTAGSIESASFDHIRIYDGTSAAAPLLYQNTAPFPGTNLAGIQEIGTSGSIFMKVTSNGSGSCQSGSQTSWAWQVGCFDCVSPTATYSVVPDCANDQFSVAVHITTLGSDPTLVISADSLGTALATATDTGVYTVGPFPIDTAVTITLNNSDNALCSVSSNPLVNGLCPTIVVCGDPNIQETYCYVNNDTHTWHWQASDGTSSLIMAFSAGSIQSGDFVRIYNGPNDSSPLLYQNNGTTNLTNIQAIASSGHLFMKVTANATVSCGNGGITPWAWQVGCLDCAPATATYTVLTDCPNFQFSVVVHITELGSDSTLDIIADGSPTVLATATDTGSYTVGPFTTDTPVNLTLTNSSNSLCSVHSPSLINSFCPTQVVCGQPPLSETYCYINNDNHTWNWASSDGTSALSILFSAGTIESASFDHLTIYNGPNASSPVLFDHVGAAENLAGYQFTAASGQIFMKVTSDGSVSCSSGSQTQWAWQVGCLDCAPPAATYSVVTDCDSMQYHVAVNITSLGSDPVIDITNNSGVPPMPATAPGTYNAGPFPAGTPTTITLVNDANSLCNVHSGVMINPLCPTVLACGADPITETYCYTNSDSHAWHWQCACNSPLALQFSAGSIESSFFDHLTIYDGPDNSSPILFQHGTTAEQLAGLLLISTGSDIYMEMSSDGSISCSSGSYDTWVWTIGCLDCTNPAATFSVVPDCQHASYQVAVNVSNTGSSSTVRIANTASLDTLMNVPSGITLVGPISMDSTSYLTVMNATNGLCRVFSDSLGSDFSDCIIDDCGPVDYSYCYTNNDTSYFAYASTSGLPIAITFQSGQLLVSDYVQIYDSAGVSPQTLLFQGNYNGVMAGHSWNSSNPQNALVMRVVSDGSYSCASGDATVLLNWKVQCGYAGVDEEQAVSFTMFPNPATGELYMRLPSDTRGSTEVRILDVSGRDVYHKTFTAAGAELNTFDLHGLQRGNYSVVVTTPNWVKAQNLQIMH